MYDSEGCAYIYLYSLMVELVLKFDRWYDLDLQTEQNLTISVLHFHCQLIFPSSYSPTHLYATTVAPHNSFRYTYNMNIDI